MNERHQAQRPADWRFIEKREEGQRGRLGGPSGVVHPGGVEVGCSRAWDQ